VFPIRRHPPEVEAIVRDAFSRADLKGLESKDMLLQDGSLGGSVFAMHNSRFVSVKWLLAYLVDTDSNYFMTHVRALAMNDKENLPRICSSNYTYNEPTWLQSREKKSPHLYLSQRATVTEESWLIISSYIINLLIGSINQRLNVLTCGTYKLDPVNYNAGVVNLGNPSVGGIGLHADGKNGLVCASTPGYGRFQMDVITLAVQNHCAATSGISWWLNDDLKKIKLAEFFHDFFIIHWSSGVFSP
jgi:hypothetical protein